MKSRTAGIVVVALVALAASTAQCFAGIAPGSFAPTGSMSVPRYAPAAAPLPDGGALVAGGISDFGPHSFKAESSAEVFDPGTGTFSLTTGVMSEPRSGAAAAPLQDGRVLIAEGGSAEIFDPATGFFSPTGQMVVARGGPAAAPLPDGRVLVAGGTYSDSSGIPYPLKSAEIFDPATGSFSPTGTMTVARSNPAAAPLPGGRVLVAGGSNSSSVDDAQSAEIYNPVTGSFSPIARSMNFPRFGDAAAPLPDGRVLIAGGGSSVAEIFNPTTGTFSQTRSISNGRFYAAVAPIGDGRVLIAGGGGQASAELFTPGLSYRLRGRKLTVTVAVAGKLTAADAGNTRRPSLKSGSESGGPGSISLRLSPIGRAMRIFERDGKVKIRAKLSFRPARVRGRCRTLTGPCYSSAYAITHTVTLTLKEKKKI